jgi:hypothetical protein
MEKADQGQCCKGNLGWMNVGEEMSGATRMQQWNKGLTLKMVAVSKEGEGNWQQHQRMEQKTTAMTGKHGKC